MKIALEELGSAVFKRSTINQSNKNHDLKTFNILYLLDGKRSVQKIASDEAYDLDELKAIIKSLYEQGLIKPVIPVTKITTKGWSKQIIDAIIQKRSHGTNTMTQVTKTQLGVNGINPDKFTSNTPDDPVVMKKLVSLARSFGVKVSLELNPAKSGPRLSIDGKLIQQ